MSKQASGKRPTKQQAPRPSLRDVVANAEGLLSGRLQREVDAQVAATSRETILREGRVSLHHITKGTVTRSTPILIVPSMVNRWYIFDLLPSTSVVKALARAGFDVYVIDWSGPMVGDDQIPFETYVPGFVHKAVRRIELATGAEQVHMIGYCMGGTFALVYAALYPERVRTLTLMATPVDFSRGGTIATWASKEHFDARGFVDGRINVPHQILHKAFGLIKPTWQLKQILPFLEGLGSRAYLEGYLAVTKWTTDNVDVPNDVFVRYAQDCYQDNLLVQGKLSVGGRRARLDAVTCPVRSLVSSSDFLVPPESSTGLDRWLGSDDVVEYVYKTGHIGLSIGPLAMTSIWPETIEWLGARDA